MTAGYDGPGTHSADEDELRDHADAAWLFRPDVAVLANPRETAR